MASHPLVTIFLNRPHSAVYNIRNASILYLPQMKADKQRRGRGGEYGDAAGGLTFLLACQPQRAGGWREKRKESRGERELAPRLCLQWSVCLAPKGGREVVTPREALSRSAGRPDVGGEKPYLG